MPLEEFVRDFFLPNRLSATVLPEGSPRDAQAFLSFDYLGRLPDSVTTVGNMRRLLTKAFQLPTIKSLVKTSDLPAILSNGLGLLALQNDDIVVISPYFDKNSDPYWRGRPIMAHIQDGIGIREQRVAGAIFSVDVYSPTGVALSCGSGNFADDCAPDQRFRNFVNTLYYTIDGRSLTPGGKAAPASLAQSSVHIAERLVI